MATGKEKARPLPAGLESFGRGCLKGPPYVQLQHLLCKCEKVGSACKKRNRLKSLAFPRLRFRDESRTATMGLQFEFRSALQHRRMRKRQARHIVLTRAFANRQAEARLGRIGVELAGKACSGRDLLARNPERPAFEFLRRFQFHRHTLAGQRQEWLVEMRNVFALCLRGHGRTAGEWQQRQHKAVAMAQGAFRHGHVIHHRADG